MVMKRPASRPAVRFTLKQCRAIIRRIAALDGIPDIVHRTLKQVEKLVRSDQDSAIAMLKEALRNVEQDFLNALRVAYRNIDGAGTEKLARIDAQAIAESHLQQLRNAVAERKKALASAEKAIEARRFDVVNAKAALKVAVSELKVVASKRSNMEAVEKDIYSPLREASAGRQDGQKSVQKIRKTGKEYGFHGELLSVLPAILRKHPDKRQTFDGIVMQQLEREFAKHSAKLKDAVSKSQACLDNHSFAVEAAQSRVIEAKEHRKRCCQDLANAEAALLEGKQKIVASRHHVRNYAKDMRCNARELARAKARVTKLRKGVLAEFSRIVPQSIEQEKPEDADIMDADTEAPVMDESDHEQA